MKTLKRLLVFSLIILLWGRGTADMTTGSIYQGSPFRFDNDGSVYICKKNYSGSLFEKLTLYLIDLDRLIANRIMSINNGNSRFYLCSDSIVYRQPTTLFSQFSYGPDQWYKASFDGLSRHIRKTTKLPVSNDAKLTLRYFVVSNTIYGALEPDYYDEQTSTSTLYCLTEKGLQFVSNVDAPRIYNYDSVIVLPNNDGSFRLYNKYSGVKEINILSMNQFSDIILINRLLLYVNGNALYALNIDNDAYRIIGEYSTKKPQLFSDGVLLYVFDKTSKELYAYSINGDLNLMSTFVLPKDIVCTDWIVNNGFFLYYNSSSGNLGCYTLETGEITVIEFR